MYMYVVTGAAAITYISWWVLCHRWVIIGHIFSWLCNRMLHFSCHINFVLSLSLSLSLSITNSHWDCYLFTPLAETVCVAKTPIVPCVSVISLCACAHPHTRKHHLPWWAKHSSWGHQAEDGSAVVSSGAAMTRKTRQPQTLNGRSSSLATELNKPKVQLLHWEHRLSLITY